MLPSLLTTPDFYLQNTVISFSLPFSASWSFFSKLWFVSRDCLFSFRITVSLSVLSCPVMEENLFCVVIPGVYQYQYQIDQGLIKKIPVMLGGMRPAWVQISRWVHADWINDGHS